MIWILASYTVGILYGLCSHMLAGYIPHACSKALCLMCGSTEEEALYMHIATVYAFLIKDIQP